MFTLKMPPDGVGSMSVLTRYKGTVKSRIKRLNDSAFYRVSYV